MSSSRVFADGNTNINQKKIFLENLNKKLINDESQSTQKKSFIKLNNSSSISSKKNSKLINGKIITFNNLRGKFSEESKISNEKKEYVKFEYSLSEDQSSISSEIKNINENKNSSEKITFPFIKKKTTLSDIRKANLYDSKGNSSYKLNYQDFNLVYNCFAEFKCSTPIHKFLPYCYKDDENYKIRLCQFIKDGKFENSRSLGGKYFDYIKNEVKFNKNVIKRDSFINDNDYFINKRKKKIFSSNKVYISEKLFFKTKIINGCNINDKKNIVKFGIFFDRDIGFNKKWQKKLKETDMDDDVESDNETLKYAFDRVFEDIDEGIDSFTRNKCKLRNFKYLKKH